MDAKTTVYAKWLIRILIGLVVGYLIWHYWPAKKVETVLAADGTHLKFRTQQDHIELYDQQAWTPFFVKGVNLGAALPGYDPGDLPITKDHYLRWFAQIQDMGANTIRVYTILKPVFYDALVEYNQQHAEKPLYFIQGIWTPEEELIEKKDAYIEQIYNRFKSEITDAVGAVYGSIDIPEHFGQASGIYRSNAGPYLLGWHIGTEWDPAMVKNTNEQHKDKKDFIGTYLSAKPQANPFENWLAEMLDHLANTEAPFGWKHPLAFTNWVTTDPLTHPGEVLIEEDMVSVDATHLQVKDWAAGYFATFHAYPYYPDFFRLDDTLQDVREADGTANTYKSYLRKLKAYHAGMPVIISEFGVPSSMGVAHLGSMGRDQGGHDEQEQGRINASLLQDIYSEGMAGAAVFSWQDEWFKRTWNTMHFEIPATRRKLWHNVLTNEQHFGLLAMLSSKDGPLIIDGATRDWDALKSTDKQKLDMTYPGLKEITMTHDEAYVYINAKLEQPFDPERELLYLGVDTLPGGNKHAKELGDKQLDEGLETLIVLGKDGESDVRIASNYDMHTRVYGKQYGMKAWTPEEFVDDSGVFNTWKLAVGLEFSPPDSKKYGPFEEVSVGALRRGTTNPDSPQYNSLSMWQAQGDTIEVRIPWMLLGFTDPSSLQVISYEDKEKRLFAQPTEGIRLVPWIVNRATGKITGLEGTSSYPVSQLPIYSWKPWDQVTYVERVKQSYKLMQQAYQSLGQK
ncbi:hypothetical protein [Paenibacillus sp. FSL H7-0331]|uniref:hypothetical protein n=1 Tax=Paenibacillus sp. FSL H7-0331 TaxID=1920421 RepID=UPI00096DD7CC|nr:hypothetical protein [Paenibacillus sp. FSL H7-0331]OMF16107.1 hypothetical protein BK127_14760 [Paenibacillus sp. FSL H7-0331]